MKRTKYVYSSSHEVFHLWANQSQDSARQGGRITRAFFEGESCYSYGKHYELGRLVTINGIQVALINRSGYSHTTAKHIHEASNAASHLLQVTVDGSFDWETGLVNMQSELIDDLFNILNKRSFWSEVKVKAYSESILQFNILCSALGKPELELHPDEFTLSLIQAHIDRCIKRTAELKALRETPEYTAKQAAKREKEQARALAKYDLEIQAWKSGGPFTNAVTSLRPHILRIRGNVVETNTHATVTLDEARQALRAVLSGEADDGMPVGSYTFKDRNADIVRVGCHTFSLEQVKSVLLTHLKLVG